MLFWHGIQTLLCVFLPWCSFLIHQYVTFSMFASFFLTDVPSFSPVGWHKIHPSVKIMLFWHGIQTLLCVFLPLCSFCTHRNVNFSMFASFFLACASFFSPSRSQTNYASVKEMLFWHIVPTLPCCFGPMCFLCTHLKEGFSIFASFFQTDVSFFGRFGWPRTHALVKKMLFWHGILILPCFFLPMCSFCTHQNVFYSLFASFFRTYVPFFSPYG